MLLLYRSGSHANDKILREMIDKLNKKYKEIWLIHLMIPGNIVMKLFP